MKCECCNLHPATQVHHKLPQRKMWRKLYGRLIHNLKNIQYVCEHCHTSHMSPRLTIWSEEEFCRALGIEVKSKTGKVKKW